MAVDAAERSGDFGLAWGLVEELLRTAFALGGAYVSLLEDLPDDVFPGEDHAAVLIEMFAGSSLPALQPVSEADCRVATALAVAVREHVLGDLRIAAAPANPGA